jgi:hypothetical protein
MVATNAFFFSTVANRNGTGSNIETTRRVHQGFGKNACQRVG